jgi:hypothetical protein
MAIKRTPTGYQIRWYAPDGKERKQTYEGISRELAEQKEREILHKRDYGETTPNPRHAPTLEEVAKSGSSNTAQSGSSPRWLSIRTSWPRT